MSIKEVCTVVASLVVIWYLLVSDWFDVEEPADFSYRQSDPIALKIDTDSQVLSVVESYKPDPSMKHDGIDLVAPILNQQEILMLWAKHEADSLRMAENEDRSNINERLSAMRPAEFEAETDMEEYFRLGGMDQTGLSDQKTRLKQLGSEARD